MGWSLAKKQWCCEERWLKGKSGKNSFPEPFSVNAVFLLMKKSDFWWKNDMLRFVKTRIIGTVLVLNSLWLLVLLLQLCGFGG